MNEQQLQVIKERVEKATQGKWFIDGDGDISDARGSSIAFSKLGPLHTPVIDWDGVEDKIFVSNAVNDVQALVSEVERLQELLKGNDGMSVIQIREQFTFLYHQAFKYRKALEFYANTENWQRTSQGESEIIQGQALPNWEPSSIEFDQGEKARRALEDKQ